MIPLDLQGASAALQWMSGSSIHTVAYKETYQSHTGLKFRRCSDLVFLWRNNTLIEEIPIEDFFEEHKNVFFVAVR